MKSTHHNTAENVVTSCRRCGICCKKGGPAFHQIDRPLIENGLIQIRYLYTIRKGELVRDPIRGSILPVDSELVKIKSKADEGTCTFYDDLNEKCQIYTDRPIECQLLKCWDTRALEEMYEQDRLSREDLLADVAGLWELAVEHEQRCGYSRMGDLISRLKKEYRKHLADEVGAIIAYDNHLRQLVIEKGQIEPETLDFIFGRSLKHTIELFGVRLQQVKGKIIMTTSGLP